MIHFIRKRKCAVVLPVLLALAVGLTMPVGIQAKEAKGTEGKGSDPVFAVPAVNNPIPAQEIKNLKIVETGGRWLVSSQSLSQYGIQEVVNKPGNFRFRLPEPQDTTVGKLWENPNVELLLPGISGKNGYTVSIQHVRRPMGISYVLLPTEKELQPPLTPVQAIPELKAQTLPKPGNKKGKIDTVLLWDPKMPAVSDIPSLKAKLPVISPCAFRLTKEGMDLRNPDFDTLLASYRDKGYAIWPLVDNDFDPKLTHEFLANQNLQDEAIKKMVGYAILYGLNGYNLDFENVDYADKDKLTQFVGAICKACHAYGLTVSMDITALSDSPNWSMVYDRPALSKHLDYFALMAYDQFNRTSPVAGPVASYPWVEKAVKDLTNLVPAEKVLLGMPLYMRTWYATANKDILPANPDSWTIPDTPTVASAADRLDVRTLSMTDSKKLFSRFKKNIKWNDELKLYYLEMPVQKGNVKIWFEDEKSLHQKAELLRKYKLAGAAFWRKGFEPLAFWQNFPD